MTWQVWTKRRRNSRRSSQKDVGVNAVFYDNYYKAQLARPSLDTLLQSIYAKQSKLTVVFLSSGYQSKEWCGLEFRVIKEKIMDHEHQRVMLVRTDDGEVEGIFKTDGYVDARTHSPEQLTRMIEERVSLL